MATVAAIQAVPESDANLPASSKPAADHPTATVAAVEAVPESDANLPASIEAAADARWPPSPLSEPFPSLTRISQPQANRQPTAKTNT
jgi:hypothetical protein